MFISVLSFFFVSYVLLSGCNGSHRGLFLSFNECLFSNLSIFLSLCFCVSVVLLCCLSSLCFTYFFFQAAMNGAHRGLLRFCINECLFSNLSFFLSLCVCFCVSVLFFLMC